MLLVYTKQESFVKNEGLLSFSLEAIQRSLVLFSVCCQQNALGLCHCHADIAWAGPHFHAAGAITALRGVMQQEYFLISAAGSDGKARNAV